MESSQPAPNVPGKKHLCERCSFSTSRKQNLNNHVKGFHDKIREFACGQCSYNAPTLNTLKLHIKAIHNKIKDFACDHCAYKATQKGTLNRHLIAKHKIGNNSLEETNMRDEKEHQSEQCDNKSVQTLNRHGISIHDMKRDFDCEQCDHKTLRKDQINCM